MRGRVVDAEGRPIEGVDVRLYRLDPAREGSTRSDHPVRTDADGRFEFGPSPETEAGVALGASPQVDQPFRSRQSCEIAAHGDTTIVLAPGAGVRVRAVDSMGAPLDASEWRVSLARDKIARADADRLRAVYERLVAVGVHAEDWESRLVAAGIDVTALRQHASAGGIGASNASVDRNGSAEFRGLVTGTFRVRLYRHLPGQSALASVDPECTAVESGDAEVVDGRLVLRGPATVVVRVAVDAA